MAFDHPVEADRVDLSLASIMSRAPVIGSLMYLLGGQHAREEEAYVVDAALNENLDTANSQDAAPNQKPIKSALKKSSPSLAPTEDSDNESFLSATDTSERASGTSDADSCFRRKKKELSWSDESGQNLVEYMDALEVSSNSRLQRLQCGHSGRWYLFVPKGQYVPVTEIARLWWSLAPIFVCDPLLPPLSDSYAHFLLEAGEKRRHRAAPNPLSLLHGPLFLSSVMLPSVIATCPFLGQVLRVKYFFGAQNHCINVGDRNLGFVRERDASHSGLGKA